MKKISLIILSLLVLSSLMMAADEPAKCPKKVPVLTEKLAGQSFVEHVSFQGTLQSESVSVTAKVDGTVTALLVGEGDLVSMDFHMLELNEGLRGEMAAFEKELALWQKRLKTRQAWKERNAKAEAQAEEQIRRVEEKLAGLRQQALESLVYAAPLAGRITGLKTAAAQQVTSGEPLLTIVNNRKKVALLEMTPDLADLFDQDSYQLNVAGTMMNAVKLGYQNGRMALAVADEEQTIAEGTGFSLTLVKKNHQNALVVAESIVSAAAGKDVVYVLDGDVARQRVVGVLAREESKALIASGLALDEEVIVAEIADAKKAVIKDSFVCLKDGGAVTVMIKDEAKNRLVKRPKTAQAKVHEAKKPELPKEQPKVEEKPVQEVKAEVKKEKVKEEEAPVEGASEKTARWAIGVRLGMLSSSYSFDLADLTAKSKQTMSFAGMFEYAVTRDISVGAEVASLNKDATFQLTYNSATYDLAIEKAWLELTIYGKYRLPLRIDKAGHLRPYLLLGFFYGQKSSGTFQWVYNPGQSNQEIVTEDDTDETWGDVDAGPVFGLGFDYALSPSFSLLLDARYGIGTRDLKGNQVADEVKCKGMQLSLGGLFRF